MTLETFLSTIERLDAKATKGPWVFHADTPSPTIYSTNDESVSSRFGTRICGLSGPGGGDGSHFRTLATGPFIAHSRLALPAAARLLRIYQQSAASRMTLLDYELLQNAIAAELAAMGGKDDK